MMDTIVHDLTEDARKLQVQIDDLWLLNAKLRDENARLRADAERYRWLREGLQIRRDEAMNGKYRAFLMIKLGRCLVASDSAVGMGETVDAAIDAARAGKGE